MAAKVRFDSPSAKTNNHYNQTEKRGGTSLMVSTTVGGIRSSSGVKDL